MEPPAAFLQLLNSLHGSVCELGPGSGAQIEFFGPRADIDVVYGIEPNADLHAKLRELAARAAFAPDQYRIVGCGAEPESLVPALARLGLLPTTGGAGGAGAGGAADGVFDDILCIKVLCGVPRLPETVEGLYRLLRPGGRLIVQEHVVNKCAAPTGSYVARAAQALAMALGWRLWMAGCELDRDTEAVLRQAARAHGGWQAVVLDTINSNTALPMIQGYLQKRA